jgi:AcrR family transcriptional regulator
MPPGLRELKKQRTRAAIQQAALDLIDHRGYENTTCEQIAAAAEVSPATFFRYFRTKEDVVLTDDYDPLMSRAVAARPAGEGPVLAVRRAMADAFETLDSEALEVVRSRTVLLLSVPALRARANEQMESARAALAESLAPRMARDADDLTVQTLAAALAAAMAVAVEHWAKHGGDLPATIDEALSTLARR